MNIKALEISPDFVVRLDYPEGVAAPVVRATAVLIRVISPAIVEDGVYIQGALLTPVGEDSMRVGFYRQAGRFIREYDFPTQALLEAAHVGGELLDTEARLADLPQEVVEKMRRQMDLYRRW
jgi:hypothetical protein